MWRIACLRAFVLFAVLLLVACGGTENPSLTSPDVKADAVQAQGDSAADPATTVGAVGGQSEVAEPGKNPLVQQEPPFKGSQTGQTPPLNETGSSVDLVAGQVVETPEPDLKMVDALVGQQYSPGMRVNFPEGGVSFVIPDEWIGQLPDGAEAFILVSSTRQGLVVAVAHEASETNELVTLLRQPIPLDQGVILNLQGQPQDSGSVVSAEVSVTDGSNNYPGYLIAPFRSEGSGVIFAAFGGETVEYYETLVGELAATFRETEISVAETQVHAGAPSSAQSAEVKEWDEFLRGKKATYLSSYSSNSPGGGGFSSQREYYLCRDGRFQYGDSNTTSGGDFGSFTGGNPSTFGSGSWEIVVQGNGTAIRLDWNDGSVSEYTLGFEDDKTYFDGERHFITEDNPYC